MSTVLLVVLPLALVIIALGVVLIVRGGRSPQLDLRSDSLPPAVDDDPSTPRPGMNTIEQDFFADDSEAPDVEPEAAEAAEPEPAEPEDEPEVAEAVDEHEPQDEPEEHDEDDAEEHEPQDEHEPDEPAESEPRDEDGEQDEDEPEGAETEASDAEGALTAADSEAAEAEQDDSEAEQDDSETEQDDSETEQDDSEAEQEAAAEADEDPEPDGDPEQETPAEADEDPEPPSPSEATEPEEREVPQDEPEDRDVPQDEPEAPAAGLSDEAMAIYQQGAFASLARQLAQQERIEGRSWSLDLAGGVFVLGDGERAERIGMQVLASVDATGTRLMWCAANPGGRFPEEVLEAANTLANSGIPELAEDRSTVDAEQLYALLVVASTLAEQPYFYGRGKSGSGVVLLLDHAARPSAEVLERSAGELLLHGPSLEPGAAIESGLSLLGLPASREADRITTAIDGDPMAFHVGDAGVEVHRGPAD